MPSYRVTISCVLVAVVAVLCLRPSCSPSETLPTVSSAVDEYVQGSFCGSTSAEVYSNNIHLLQVLNRITATSYFRYFKVNAEKPCPYWAVNLLCTSAENTCDVCKCDANSIPEALRTPDDMSTVRDTPGSQISRGIAALNADDWGRWNFVDDGSEYVDLLQNPEGNTGYSGPLAARVWEAIYRENCLVSEPDNTCREVNVLRTLLSGLHYSISMQVATNYYKDPTLESPQYKRGIYNNPNISFFPNCDMFLRRLAPYHHHLGNLHVLYQFILRALGKAKSVFLSDISAYYTGPSNTATAEDLSLTYELHELFDSRLLCSRTFDETLFLESPRARELIPQMKVMMLNVTKLMDCVTCEKCRIWGKLATKGVSTALRVIMETEKPITLDRAEIVTLINLARQLSFSINSAQMLLELCPAPTPTVEG